MLNLQGSYTVTFSSGHKIFKFSISCKLCDDVSEIIITLSYYSLSLLKQLYLFQESLTSFNDLSWIKTMDNHLQNSKRRARYIYMLTHTCTRRRTQTHTHTQCIIEQPSKQQSINKASSNEISV